MLVSYSTLDSAQNELDSLPWLPLILGHAQHEVEAIGLVDSGATVNVMPYEIGVRPGAAWDDQKAVIQLAGNLGRLPAMPNHVLVRVLGMNEAKTWIFAGYWQPE